MTPRGSLFRKYVIYFVEQPLAEAFVPLYTALGYATLGTIGFEFRRDYAAIGSVTNLAARLCGEAKGREILTNRRSLSEMDGLVLSEPAGELALKGFIHPVQAFKILEFVKR